MGPRLMWLPLLLIIYMQQVQANRNLQGSSLKPVNDKSAVGKAVNRDVSTYFHGRQCECKGVHGTWVETPCLCAKFSRRKIKRANWRKLCRWINVKHFKKCRVSKKKPGHYGPIVPI